MIAIFGIIIVGSVIKDALGIANAIVLLFLAVGGVALFAKFYKKNG